MDNKRLDSTWEMMHKDNDGDAQITELHKYVYDTDPIDLNALLVNRAAPTRINPSRRKKPTRSDTVTLAMGDAQIGFRDQEPFHSERAMALGLVAVREVQPDNIVLTGDMIDLQGMSKFTQRSDWANNSQMAIDRYHQYLAELRANAPDANIVVVHGNHELRMDKYIQQNAAEVLGLRRANMAHELAVLTLQYLVRYDDLGVTGIDGYPNAAYWLEDDLKVTHGTNVAKAGSNVAKYLQQEKTSTIFGHTHRLELGYRTIPTRGGKSDIVAASPGCLARVDGSVPGYRYSVNAQGETVHRAEDWQNGALVILHNERNHHVQPMRMDSDGIQIFDRRYQL